MCSQRESATDRLLKISRCEGPTGNMLSILAAGSVFFPGLFLLSKQCLKHIPGLRWSEGDAVIVSARWVNTGGIQKIKNK